MIWDRDICSTTCTIMSFTYIHSSSVNTDTVSRCNHVATLGRVSLGWGSVKAMSQFDKEKLNYRKMTLKPTSCSLKRG